MPWFYYYTCYFSFLTSTLSTILLFSSIEGMLYLCLPHSLFTISFWFLYLLAKNVHLWFPLGFRVPSLFVSVAIGRLPMHQWMPHTHAHVDNIYWTPLVAFIFKAKERKGCEVGKETCWGRSEGGEWGMDVIIVYCIQTWNPTRIKDLEPSLQVGSVLTSIKKPSHPSSPCRSDAAEILGRAF